MKITIEELRKIINIEKTINVNETEVFDYCRISKLFDDKPLEKAQNVLSFPVSVTDEEVEKEGWYVSPFDNRVRIAEFIDFAQEKQKLDSTVFVIEKQMKNYITNSNVRYIVVDNIMKSIEKIANHILNNYKGKKILITGSVGKTSTAGLIEQVIKNRVLRIYSKRITPMILNSYIINYLNNNIDCLVMEAGLFRKFHVEYYARLLKPDIGIILNVLEEHLGIDGIESIEDIAVNKAKLLKHCKNAIINVLDKHLAQLNFDNNQISYNGILIGNHHLDKILKLNSFDKSFEPYIKTHLSQIQNEVAAAIGILLRINYQDIIERINNSIPPENRFQKHKINDIEIIFEGDVSSVARLKKFSQHYYKKSALVIRYLTNNGEELEDYSKLTEIFKYFNKVYIFADLKEKSLFENCKKVEFVKNHSFFNKIDKDTQVFYHYGSFYRKFAEFSLENIECNLKEERGLKKIIMIHGWNPNNYHHLSTANVWESRKQLVEKLSENFDVYSIDLPGFGNTEEPKEKSWMLNDYAKYIHDYLQINNLEVDYILGYSFGGAVALRHKTLYQGKEKLFLISPALVRAQKNQKKFIRTPKRLDKIRDILRDLYLTYVVKNEEMIKGTRFLRKTYRHIVRDELDQEIKTINPNDFAIIYGHDDSFVDPKRIIEELGNDYKNNIFVIENGGHNIGLTHSRVIKETLTKLDKEYSKKKEVTIKKAPLDNTLINLDSQLETENKIKRGKI